MNAQQYQLEIWNMKVAVKISLLQTKRLILYIYFQNSRVDQVFLSILSFKFDFLVSNIKILNHTLYLFYTHIYINYCYTAIHSNIPSMYIMIYRQHFLLFYFQQIYNHFDSYCSQVNKINQISLQFKNVLLPYQIPFGVLVDQYQSEDTFTPLELILIYQKESNFINLEDEIRNQIKFNQKLAAFGRYNHEGYGNPLKNSVIMKISDENIVLNQIQSFENIEDLQKYYGKLFESPKTGRYQLPIRIYFKKGGYFQTIIELNDQKQTIGQALSTKLQGTSFLFNGLPLKTNIPALNFYDWLYSIDGFCYFVCE